MAFSNPGERKLVAKFRTVDVPGKKGTVRLTPIVWTIEPKPGLRAWGRRTWYRVRRFFRKADV